MVAAGVETRSWPGLIARAAEGGKALRLSGQFAKYDSPSDGLSFVEVIRPGAFRSAFEPGADVRLLADHDSGKVLARTASGTLKLEDSESGPTFTAELDPESTLARDIYLAVKRGDLSQMSFGFRVLRDNWAPLPDGGHRHELIEVELLEISTVSFPAYSQTSVQARRAGGLAGQDEILRFRLKLLNLRL